MRSDFNIVIVDDLFDDEDDRGVLDKFINYIKSTVANRGFVAQVNEFSSATAVLTGMDLNLRKRIDLYISDNNLEDGENEGIDFYLNLKRDFICDFILYTQSGVDGIINKIKEDLDVHKDPSLFSRFTFVSRQNDAIWKSKSDDVVKHIITQREQFNNLRGLFAQSTSKMHTHLAGVVFNSGEEARFQTTIEKAFQQHYIDQDCRKKLHEIRLIRNALMHEDEQRCPDTFRYFIEYSTPVFIGNRVNESTTKLKLFETDQFHLLRQRLKTLESQILHVS